MGALQVRRGRRAIGEDRQDVRSPPSRFPSRRRRPRFEATYRQRLSRGAILCDESGHDPSVRNRGHARLPGPALLLGHRGLWIFQLPWPGGGRRRCISRRGLLSRRTRRSERRGWARCGRRHRGRRDGGRSRSLSQIGRGRLGRRVLLRVRRVRVRSCARRRMAQSVRRRRIAGRNRAAAGRQRGHPWRASQPHVHLGDRPERAVRGAARPVPVGRGVFAVLECRRPGLRRRRGRRRPARAPGRRARLDNDRRVARRKNRR